MANPYPILPLNVLDDLADLNGALDAYQQLMTAWIQQTMTEGLLAIASYSPPAASTCFAPFWRVIRA